MAPKIPSLAAGLLTIFGLLGRPTPCVAAPQGPGSGPPAATTTPAPSGPPTVLLLSNGKLLQGEILKDQSGYILKHKIGTMHFPRRNVERVFRSIREAYEYKKTLRPENDPDERMKLASWCLEQKLIDEARAELAALLQLVPEDRRAKAMLAGLDRAEGAGPGTIDSGVVRTSVEVEVAPPDSGLNRLREEFARDPRGAGMPVIFDLETPLAVRRYQEFARTVHPVLQRRCAKCHNENTPGEFQMIQAKAQRDSANDLILRANLDATLKIVDRDDLARSPILTAAGMTHGAGGRPVLGGPNSTEYRTLAAWVTNLKATGAQEAAPPAPGSATAPASEGFAAGRLATGTDPAMPPASIGPRTAKAIVPRPSLAPDHTILNENGAETTLTPAPAPAGSLIPGSQAGQPYDPPPPSAFEPPSEVEVGGRKVPIRTPEPGASSPAPLGSATMRLPSGEVVPVVSKDMTKKPEDPAKKGRKFDTKKLESFIKIVPKKP